MPNYFPMRHIQFDFLRSTLTSSLILKVFKVQIKSSKSIKDIFNNCLHGEIFYQKIVQISSFLRKKTDRTVQYKFLRLQCNFPNVYAKRTDVTSRQEKKIIDLKDQSVFPGSIVYRQCLLSEAYESVSSIGKKVTCSQELCHICGFTNNILFCGTKSVGNY